MEQLRQRRRLGPLRRRPVTRGRLLVPRKVEVDDGLAVDDLEIVARRVHWHAPPRKLFVRRSRSGCQARGVMGWGNAGETRWGWSWACSGRGLTAPKRRPAR